MVASFNIQKAEVRGWVTAWLGKTFNYWSSLKLHYDCLKNSIYLLKAIYNKSETCFMSTVSKTDIHTNKISYFLQKIFISRFQINCQ